jgi:hypothetical protein
MTGDIISFLLLAQRPDLCGLAVLRSEEDHGLNATTVTAPERVTSDFSGSPLSINASFRLAANEVDSTALLSTSLIQPATPWR